MTGSGPRRSLTGALGSAVTARGHQMEHAGGLDPLGNASDCFRTDDAECDVESPRGGGSRGGRRMERLMIGRWVAFRCERKDQLHRRHQMEHYAEGRA